MSVLSSIAALKSKINSVIYANYQQLITGPILNGILHDITDTVNSLIDTLSTNKLDKTAIGYDVTGLNLPSGASYKINGVDILTLFTSGGGGFAGALDASAGVLPTTGTGTNNAIRKGDFWRIKVAGTYTGLLPTAILATGDVLLSLVDGASVISDFVSIEGDSEIATILTRLTAVETKLGGIEDHATSDQTAAEIAASLETLTNDERLDQSAIKNIVNAPYNNDSFPQLTSIKLALDYANSLEGKQGPQGLSAYEQWRQLSGNTLKTFDDFLLYLAKRDGFMHDVLFYNYNDAQISFPYAGNINTITLDNNIATLEYSLDLGASYTQITSGACNINIGASAPIYLKVTFKTGKITGVITIKGTYL